MLYNKEVNISKIDVINAAKKLSDFYKLIIEDKSDESLNGSGRRYLARKTGFGKMKTCMLCIAVNNNCFDCIWKIQKGCINTNYIAISKSKNLNELKHHLSERIKMIDHKINLFETFYKEKQSL